jgi:hypothetical protein
MGSGWNIKVSPHDAVIQISSGALHAHANGAGCWTLSATTIKHNNGSDISLVQVTDSTNVVHSYDGNKLCGGNLQYCLKFEVK